MRAIGEDRALAEAMTDVIAVLHRSEGRDAVQGACQIRAALTPQNGYQAAFVPFDPVCAAIARGLRAVADGGHPLAAKLTAMAAELSPDTAASEARPPSPAPAPPRLVPAPPPAS